MLHTISHLLGLDNLSGPFYGFWSGFGSDLGEITLVSTVVIWWRMHECHVNSCRKFGKYPFQHYKLCKNHHPNVPNKLTHLHIMKLHKGSK